VHARHQLPQHPALLEPVQTLNPCRVPLPPTAVCTSLGRRGSHRLGSACPEYHGRVRCFLSIVPPPDRAGSNSGTTIPAMRIHLMNLQVSRWNPVGKVEVQGSVRCC
jgi:hypothetical protein